MGGKCDQKKKVRKAATHRRDPHSSKGLGQRGQGPPIVVVVKKWWSIFARTETDYRGVLSK